MKTQAKQRLIIVPSEETPTEVCDFVHQTQLTLQNLGLVVWRIQVIEVVWFGKNFSSFLSFIFSSSGSQLTVPIFGLIPGNRWQVVRQINSRIFIKILKLKLKSLSQTEKVLWLFFPGTAGFLRQLQSVCNHSIFDIVDAFPTEPLASVKLLLRATTVTSIGHTMKKFYQKIDPKAKITVVPQGFKLAYLENFAHTALPPQHTHRNRKPIITFVGGINQRLDHKVLLDLCTKHPEWHFLMVGPLYTDTNISDNPDFSWWAQLQLCPNVQWLPPQPPRKINHLFRMSDVLIIPYDLTHAFNRYCYPMKIFEYFASQKPIVSTPIPELLTRYPSQIRFATTTSDWSKQITAALKHPLAQVDIQTRQHAILQNTWKKKITAVLKVAQLSPSKAG